MDKDNLSGDRPERRSETRAMAEPYHSVQFKTEGLPSFYQFKLWNISSKGMCILVKEDSEVLKYLKVNDTLEMTYYPTNNKDTQKNINTRIKHITKNETGRFQGHYMVGLSIISQSCA
jgi:hypothetical protein